jgi:hypothetical protein
MPKHPAESVEAAQRELPRSTVHQGVVLVGLASLAAALLFVIRWQPANHSLALLIIFGAVTAPMLAFEVFRRRHELFPYGFSSRTLQRTHWNRLAVKLLGLAFTLAPIGVAYWAFPIYREGEGSIIWSIFQIVGLPILLISPVYIWFTDVQMERPEDGLYMAGLAAAIADAAATTADMTAADMTATDMTATANCAPAANWTILRTPAIAGARTSVKAGPPAKS